MNAAQLIEQDPDVADVLIEEITEAAVIVDSIGRVLHANRRGRQLLSQRDALEELLYSVRTQEGRFRITRVQDQHQVVFLAVNRCTESSVKARIAEAVANWDLTPRQTEVLAELVHGRTNRAIAAILGIAEGTVEVHVGAVVDKAHAESRSEVIAQFWRGPHRLAHS